MGCDKTDKDILIKKPGLLVHKSYLDGGGKLEDIGKNPTVINVEWDGKPLIVEIPVVDDEGDK